MTGRKGMWAIGGAPGCSDGAGRHRRARTGGCTGWPGSRPTAATTRRPRPETLEAEPVDTREARLSLRARLAESGELVESEAAAPRARRPERVDHDPERRAVDDARERVLARARAAASIQG